MPADQLEDAAQGEMLCRPSFAQQGLLRVREPSGATCPCPCPLIIWPRSRWRSGLTLGIGLLRACASLLLPDPWSCGHQVWLAALPKRDDANTDQRNQRLVPAQAS